MGKALATFGYRNPVIWVVKNMMNINSNAIIVTSVTVIQLLGMATPGMGSAAGDCEKASVDMNKQSTTLISVLLIEDTFFFLSV
jgi:hypothetical protein